MIMDLESMHNMAYMYQLKFQMEINQIQQRFEVKTKNSIDLKLSIKPTFWEIHSPVHSHQLESEMMYTLVKPTFLKKSASVHSHGP